MTGSALPINGSEGDRDKVCEGVCYLLQAVIDAVFSIVVRNGKPLLSVPYGYVFSEFLAFTVNGFLGRLIKLILIRLLL